MIEFFLWCDSFSYHLSKEEKLLKDCLLSLTEIYETIQENGEKLIRSEKIWEQQIVQEAILGNWLYSDDPDFRDEKALLIEILNGSTTEEEKYDITIEKMKTDIVQCTGIVGLYQINHTFQVPPITCLVDLLHLYRFNTRKVHDYDLLCETFNKCFPELYFGVEVPNSIKVFRPLHQHIDEILLHLEALNDYGPELRAQLGRRTEDNLMKQLKARGKIECSLQSDPDFEKKYLRFPFENDMGKVERVICGPHTKLYHKGSEWRIYFRWFYPTVAEGKKLLIGHIGMHI